jgi:hypothetical protein
MRQLLWIVLVFALAGAWPERTAVVADAQDKKEAAKPGKGAEDGPEKDKKGHYAKIEIVGALGQAELRALPLSDRVTGTVWHVSTEKIVCYLDFQDNKDMLKLATQHKGKTVRVTGSLEWRDREQYSIPPSPVSYRVIVKVATMEPVQKK